jgi:hypothetical protein
MSGRICNAIGVQECQEPEAGGNASIVAWLQAALKYNAPEFNTPKANRNPTLLQYSRTLGPDIKTEPVAFVPVQDHVFSARPDRHGKSHTVPVICSWILLFQRI